MHFVHHHPITLAQPLATTNLFLCINKLVFVVLVWFLFLFFPMSFFTFLEE